MVPILPTLVCLLHVAQRESIQGQPSKIMQRDSPARPNAACNDDAECYEQLLDAISLGYNEKMLTPKQVAEFNDDEPIAVEVTPDTTEQMCQKMYSIYRGVVFL